MSTNPDEHMVIHPRKNKNEQPIPENGLLLVNPSEASQCLREVRQKGGRNRFLFNSELVVAENPPFFVAGPAIGAPMAALTVEKLIALGAKKVILFGWCGAISQALQVGDVVVPEKAASGEGTSAYYTVDTDTVLGPDARLSRKIAKLFTDNDLAVRRDCVWSTDALYREDKRVLQQLHRDKQVGAVDMEFSALCAVAAYRGIEFAAVLTVSDELWGSSWRPGFGRQLFLERKQAALTLLLDHLSYSGAL